MATSGINQKGPKTPDSANKNIKCPKWDKGVLYFAVETDPEIHGKLRMKILRELVNSSVKKKSGKPGKKKRWADNGG